MLYLKLMVEQMDHLNKGGQEKAEDGFKEDRAAQEKLKPQLNPKPREQ